MRPKHQVKHVVSKRQSLPQHPTPVKYDSYLFTHWMPSRKEIVFGELCYIIIGKINWTVTFRQIFHLGGLFIFVHHLFVLIVSFANLVYFHMLFQVFLKHLPLMVRFMSQIFFFLSVQVHKENVPVQRQGRSKILHICGFMPFIAMP